MIGLAKLMLSLGKEVSGSDFKKTEGIKDLKKQGVNVFIGHNKWNVVPDIDLVVFTGAIKENNIELLTAKKLGIKTLERSEFLGFISTLYENVIAISGTHGKTTTTAIIGKIFQYAKLDPTIHIGGEVKDFKSSFVVGGKKYFITEACEYRESFKYLKPNTSVITNIESDHIDYYKTFDNLKLAFNNFAKSVKETLILCNNKYIDQTKLNCDIVSVGISCISEIQAHNILEKNSGYSFDVLKQDELIGNFSINLTGFHNIYNCLCAIAVALKYGIKANVIKKALEEFEGIKRRNEYVGNIDGVPVVCDYAHHPTEIINSINAIKEKYKKVLCVFQPHTYSRTSNLMEEFKTCFEGVDHLIIFKTYSAREKYSKKGSAKSLFKNVKCDEKNYINSDYMLKKKINKISSNFDVVLVLGAGDIYNRVKKVIINKKICWQILNFILY